MADNLKTIKCPACGNIMKKVFIKSANINLDICTDGCGGIFFDNRELEKFDEQHENAEEIFEVLDNKTFITVNESAQRVCPICKVPMVRMGEATGVPIDCCHTCGGKFLDNGELQKIRAGLNEETYKKIAAEFDSAVPIDIRPVGIRRTMSNALAFFKLYL